MRYYSLAALFLLQSVLIAQSENVDDYSVHAEKLDRSTQEFMNNTSVENQLINGGAFYVSNPPPLYKVEIEKAYINPKFEKMVVTFRNGETAEIFGRIRTVDQKVEVMREGGVFELRDNYTESIETESGAVYSFLLDPMKKIKGMGVYEVAFAGKKFDLLVHRTAVWKDPPPKNMFDTSEPERTLEPKERVILRRHDGRTCLVKNAKTLVVSLDTEGMRRATPLRRSLKIKNNPEDYVRLLNAVYRE